MKNQKTKIVSSGYPFYSRNVIEVREVDSDFTFNDEKAFLIIAFVLLLSTGLSLNFLIPVKNVSAFTLQPLSVENDNIFYTPRPPRGLSGRGRIVGFVFGYFVSNMIGGILLWPPSKSMSYGYCFGYVWYIICNNYY